MRCRLRLFGQVVFQPSAVKIPNFWRDFAGRARGRCSFPWHVSETGHVWRSVGAQAFALAVADGTIDWSGWRGDESRAESATPDRSAVTAGASASRVFSLLGGTASGDLNAEFLHPGVKRRPLHS